MNGKTSAPGGTVRVRVDGRSVEVAAGATVAVAVLAAGIKAFRRSADGAPRGPVCGMGICFECCVTLDGRPHQRSCLIPCREGMEVATGMGAADGGAP